jgi:peptide/nickel transport system permease protein
MSSYIVRRLVLSVPTLFLVSLTVFFVLRVMPGDVTTALLQDVRYSQQDADQLRERLGLDRPLPVQYLTWVGGIARLDFGESLVNGTPIWPKIRSAAPVTIEIAVLALIISVLFGVPVGVLAAVYQDRWPDYVLRGLAILWLSAPGFWLATILLVIGARYLNWAPEFQYHPLIEDPVANLKQFLVPAALLGAATSASIIRLTRGMLLEVLRQDYIRTAYSKGLRQRSVVVTHALRNAFIPVITVIGLQLAALLGGTVIFETIFALPGIGRLTIDAVTYRDYNVIQDINLIIAAAVLGINLVVDLTCGLLDPRIRFG